MISENLKQKRTEAKLTQEQLGIQLGVTSDIISNWERGITQIPSDYIIPLCQTFHCSPTLFVNMDRHSVDWYIENYDAVTGITDFAVANPDLMDMILFMTNKWDGDFAMLVLMAYYYCLLDKGERSHISYLVGMMFRSKHYNTTDDTVRKAYNRLPDYIKEWKKLTEEGIHNNERK